MIVTVQASANTEVSELNVNAANGNSLKIEESVFNELVVTFLNEDNRQVGLFILRGPHAEAYQVTKTGKMYPLHTKGGDKK